MKKLLLVGILAPLSGYAVVKYAVTKSDADLVENRLWIDMMPRRDTDLATMFAMIGEEGEGAGLGVQIKQSQWYVERHLFIWEEGNVDSNYAFHFPQFDTVEFGTVTAYECTAPEPFELCMDMQVRNSNKFTTKRFYSRHDWVVGNDVDVKDIELGCLTGGC